MSLHDYASVFAWAAFVVGVACQGANLFDSRIYVAERVAKDRRKAGRHV
jgi:hypothetical protein